jgi:hypothetical protein
MRLGREEGKKEVWEERGRQNEAGEEGEGKKEPGEEKEGKKGAGEREEGRRSLRRNKGRKEAEEGER